MLKNPYPSKTSFFSLILFVKKNVPFCLFAISLGCRSWDFTQLDWQSCYQPNLGTFLVWAYDFLSLRFWCQRNSLTSGCTFIFGFVYSEAILANPARLITFWQRKTQLGTQRPCSSVFQQWEHARTKNVSKNWVEKGKTTCCNGCNIKAEERNFFVTG